MPKNLAAHPRVVLEQIIDSALDAFVVIDSDSAVLAWTRQAQALFGWTREEAVGQQISQLIIPPNLRQAHAEGMRRYLDSGEARVLGRRIEIDAQDKQGRIFPVELSINVAELDGRKIFSAAIRDITEVKAHQRDANRLWAVVDATSDFVGFADLSGRTLYMNRAGRAMVGLGPDEDLDGRSIRDKYPAWAHEIVQRGIDYALAEGTWSGESALLRPDGTEMPTSQVIIAPRDVAGRPQFIATIIRDISDRHRIEQSLRTADRRKDEFLAMLAHELRNPLAPIATAAKILSAPGLMPDRVQRASNIISRQVGYMTRLLDDLLDVSRVTRGLIKMESKLVELSTVVQDAIEQARPEIEARRHELRVRTFPGTLLVRGDRTRLVQVIVNLLTNAARYTPEGGVVHVELSAEGREAVMAVRDTGIGIPADMLGQIFEVFTQVERPVRSEGGLGLGLALVKHLTELHGGRVSASSEGPGRGSCFTVVLPLADG